MEKKIYSIPTMDVVVLNTARIMGTPSGSDHSEPHSAPQRRDPVF